MGAKDFEVLCELAGEKLTFNALIFLQKPF
jgi:hypothetical protein